MDDIMDTRLSLRVSAFAARAAASSSLSPPLSSEALLSDDPLS
jgi:hypothetical protein